MPAYFCLSVVVLDPESAFPASGDGGEPGWPPSPLRVYAACVFGALARNVDDAASRAALSWLEHQPPALLILPESRTGSPSRSAGSDHDHGNHLDVTFSAGRPDREPGQQPAELNPVQTLRPKIENEGDTIHYLWPLPDVADDPALGHARTLAEAARGMITTNRGSRQVAARARVLTQDDADALPGQRWLPTTAPAGILLRVPIPGTLESLCQLYACSHSRVELAGEPFPSVASLARYGTVGYRRATDSPAWCVAAFSLLEPDATGYRPFDSVRDTARVAGLVRHTAALAAERAGWPRERIATFVHGHTPDGNQRARGAPNLPRFAYLPLPSIEARPGGLSVGAIQRILLVSPPEHAAEIVWARRALAGQDLLDERSGLAVGLLSLIPGDDPHVGRYVGRGGGAACWSTVTPVVLPGHDDGDPRKAERLLRRALEHSGVPGRLAREAELEWRVAGFHAGVDLATRYQLPACYQGRLRYHLRVRWWSEGRPHRWTGPLVVGAGRYAGFGLLTSEPE